MINKLKLRLFFWWIPGWHGICSTVEYMSELKLIDVVLAREGFNPLTAFPIPHKNDFEANELEYQNSWFKYSPFTAGGRCRRRLAKLIIKELESDF